LEEEPLAEEHPSRVRFLREINGGEWWHEGLYFEGAIKPDDARDLLAMHALRWCLDLPVFQLCSGANLDEDAEAWEAIKSDMCDPDPLATIIEATKHLEPAETR
jgi:hypothetical protein